MNVLLPYLASPIILIGLSYWERKYPLYPYGSDKGWHKRLFIYAALGLLATTLIGLASEPFTEKLNAHSVVAHFFSETPSWLNGFVAYFFISFFVYWWHRYRHHSNTAWKVFHQIHHSTYRLQAATAFYAHPSDFAANLTIINLVSYGLLGLNIESAAWATLWVAVFEYWEHTNIRTPHWLGYFIVRPEMHRIHHERNRHSNNYGLPLWDIIFGTYENSSRVVDCGFEIDEEERVVDMLACKQVQ